MTGVELDGELVRALVESGELDEGLAGRAGELPFEDQSFDVVLYRLVLHHIAYQGPVGPCFEEARRLLRPGGAMVAVEPGLWHPVGGGLALANKRASGYGFTARRTTSRSPRARWWPRRGPPASSRSFTR